MMVAMLNLAMTLALSLAGCFLLAILRVVWSRTRFSRNRARLRRLYAQQALTADVMHPVEAVTPADAPNLVDDRQMNLFDQPGARRTLQMPAAKPVVRAAHPLRRRTDLPAGARLVGQRLDRQYFNKDSGDLAYPAVKDRRRPASTAQTAVEIPKRRA